MTVDDIRDELTQILTDENPKDAMLQAYTSGLTRVILPEFDIMMNCSQNTPYHYANVGFHTLDTVKSVENTPVLRWAALLHDIGKPNVKVWVEEKQRERFLGHAEESVRISKAILERLKFPESDTNMILKLVKLHDFYTENEMALKGFADDYGAEFIDNLEKLAMADASAHSDMCRDELIRKKKAMFTKMRAYM